MPWQPSQVISLIASREILASVQSRNALGNIDSSRRQLSYSLWNLSFGPAHLRGNQGTVQMLTRYLLAWLLLAMLAIANGIIRQATYGKVLPELRAHQLSTLTAIIASGLVVWAIHRFWPIESSTQAWMIGICWLVMTIAFEFGFGHYVAGHDWSRLFADYSLAAGRVWALFLTWILVLPYLLFRLSP